jgi:hypothetical protein
MDKIGHDARAVKERTGDERVLKKKPLNSFEPRGFENFAESGT